MNPPGDKKGCDKEDRPLPNDSCERTISNEVKFIRSYDLSAITDDQKHQQSNRTATIICSRTTGERYSWPFDRAPLSALQLSSYFADSGHTLGIDYTRTYVRYFALDIDCGCRRGAKDHLSERTVSRVLEKTRSTLRSLLDLREDPRLSVWRLDCGFHVYGDVRVSLPTHLYLVDVVRASLCAEQQDGPFAILEVPSIMPLPYSAKESHRPYKPLLPTQPDTPSLTNGLGPVAGRPDNFYELFRPSGVEVENGVVATLRSDRRDAPAFFVRNTRAQCLTWPVDYSYVCGIETQLDYLDQFRIFLERVYRPDPENKSGDGTPYDLDTLIPNELVLDRVSSEAPEVTEALTDFMQRFNATFAKKPTTEPRLFVNLSLLEHGALHLQHYIVMLHKVFAVDIAMSAEAFKRSVVPAVYGERLPRDNPCLRRFLQYYDDHTLDCYTDTWEYMMEHLMFLHQHEIDPCDSLNAQIDHYMCLKMGIESASAFTTKRLKVPKDEQNKMMYDVIGHYVDALVHLRAIMFNSSTSNYYVLDDGNHYRVSCKLEGLPTVISEWTGSQRRTLEECYSRINMNKSRFTYTQTDLLSSCKFQVSTSVGVFNSLTGLYSSKTRFLRFLCHRDFAIWELNTPLQMFERQNERLVERLDASDRMADILCNRMSDVFVHFILAPAVLQLKRILFVDEFRIAKFSRMLHRHRDLSAANFLVEYFDVNIRLVFAIIHIYNKYDGPDTFSTYAKLSDHVFNYSRVDENMWRQKFTPILASLKYEKRATRLETFATMVGEGVDSPSHELCLFATLLAVCFIKCETFTPMMRAFDVDARVLNAPVLHPHPEYKDFTYETSVESCRLNMERAIRILFGKKLSAQDRSLANAIIVLGMSTYFDPENTVELLSTISAQFVAYNGLRKIFVYYGVGGVGKTLICNVLQILNSPKVGRYTNLSQAVERASVTAKTTVTILNEMHVVDADTIKTVTGNDALSAKQFYTQEYEMHNNQSLIYGATNSVISFRGRDDTDRVAIDRFHAIRLCGRQINVQKRCGSLFIMLTERQIYRGTIMFKERDLANAVAWLAYASYVRHRDTNHLPLINEENDDVAQYREDLYRSNNRLYDFLCELGIREMQGFTMSADVLLALVRQSINSNRRNNMGVNEAASSSSDKRQRRSCFDSMSDFKIQFRQQYGVELKAGRYIPDMQQINLIKHIIITMSTTRCEGSVIRDSDIDARKCMYNTIDDRDNARGYFIRENQHAYDYTTCVYNNVAFTNDFSEYTGNELEDLGVLQPLTLPSSTSPAVTPTERTFIPSNVL